MSNYFGKINSDISGYFSELKIMLPYFDEEIEVYLGKGYDDYSTDLLPPPTCQQLAEYEQALKVFLDNIDTIIVDIKQAAFENYLKYFAEYYEEPFHVLSENNLVKSDQTSGLHPPLNIDSAEKHFEYMKNVIGFMVLDKNTIIISISYALDEEHGIEFKLIDNKVAQIDAIAGTY
ncbi:MAG: hypothetical protein FWH01_05265 [Oscillospiraceae bacterium]|nr:hypothetical protein [Oscillospiraceae bacterium]